MPTEVLLPELGENVSQGDLVRVLVKVGDTIQKDQAIVELETEKAAIEVPSSAAGVVKTIHVKEGQKLKVGQSILTVEEAGGSQQAEPQAAPKEQNAEKAESRPSRAAEPAPAAQVAAQPPPAEAGRAKAYDIRAGTARARSHGYRRGTIGASRPVPLPFPFPRLRLAPRVFHPRMFPPLPRFASSRAKSAWISPRSPAAAPTAASPCRM